jgi:hypothetical protein
LSDFIDRAKLEAEADQWLIEDENWGDRHHESFLAGAAAYAALLDAETTEEWGVAYPNATWNAAPGYPMEEHLARELVDESEGVALVSRHVVRTPWLPSKGGEKRG